MLVRHPLESEADAVSALARMQAEETVPHLGYDEAIARQTFRNYLDTANPTFFVAEDENRHLCGFLMALICDYAFTGGFFTTQEVLYVRPEKRGTRAAAHLLKTFNEWSDRLGAKEVFAGVANGYVGDKVDPDRTARFMGHFGFTPVGQYLRRIRVPHG